MSTTKAVLLVSLIPRMQRGGGSALVALDGASLDLEAIRTFPDREYLPAVGKGDRVVRHSRGLARLGAHLFVAMFNSIRGYLVEDSRRLRLVPERRLTHHAAVDIHGVCVSGGRVVAASTGADRLIEWSLVMQDPSVVKLEQAREDEREDLRFPVAKAVRSGLTDWRHALPGHMHINDVCSTGPTTVAVSGLHDIWLVEHGVSRLLRRDRRALYHSVSPLGDERLVVTDAARGELVVVDRRGEICQRTQVVDPNRWFLRGVTVGEASMIVLASERGASLQRHVRPNARRTFRGKRGRGGFVATVVDVCASSVLGRCHVRSDELPAGSVAYSIVPWIEAVAPSGSRHGTA